MRHRVPAAVLALISLVLASCASVENVKDEVKLEEKKPVVRVTNYTRSLRELGLMTEIYGKGSVKIQSVPIGDNTGASGPTGGEIPRDITEMIKSSLNAIGGSVTYIPYDPAFIQNNAVTGYSNFENKLVPDIVVSGGITEFDRALLTTGSGRDAGFDASVGYSTHVSTNVGAAYGDSNKYSLSRITLDFNLVDFRTMAGIPRTNITNSIEVQKGSKDKEMGITLFGLSFGSKGSARKVEGRHAAVRLLVEASMIQLVGKYLILPYWQLLGDDIVADESVTSLFMKKFSQLSELKKVSGVQEWLYLHGFNVPVNGVMDGATADALRRFDSTVNPAAPISAETALKIYMSIPVTNEALARRTRLDAVASAATPTQPSAQQATPRTYAAPARQQPRARQEAQRPQQPAAASGRGGGIGRVLTDDEW